MLTDQTKSCNGLPSAAERGIVRLEMNGKIPEQQRPLEIILIAAMAVNRVIGRGNSIPWHIPGEQARFRRTTWGCPLIMGRKTHESVGRPLPGRRNIVVTRNPRYRSNGCEVVHSLPEAYRLCGSVRRAFNIGGEQLYRQGLAHADTLLLTVLENPFDGDAFFPQFSADDFRLVHCEQFSGPLPFSVLTYRRIHPLP